MIFKFFNLRKHSLFLGGCVFLFFGNVLASELTKIHTDKRGCPSLREICLDSSYSFVFPNSKNKISPEEKNHDGTLFSLFRILFKRLSWGSLV